MAKYLLPALSIIITISCNQINSGRQKPAVPKPPASIEAVSTELKNSFYEVTDVGTIDLFKEVDWASASTDTSKFYKDYMAFRKAFALKFVNDSAVLVTDDEKTFEAKYGFEKDTSAAVLLNLKYVDSSFSFNPGEPMMITSAYKIRGIDKEGLLLETPREMNRRKVVVLMKKK